MPTFKNMRDINLYLDKQIKIAIDRVADTMQSELLHSIEEEFYSVYTPAIYKRTYQFLNSSTRSHVKRIGNEFFIEVYVDYENLDYEDSTGYEVVSLASEGFHGNENIYRPNFFWDNFKQKFPEYKVKQMIKDELKKLGIPTR